MQQAIQRSDSPDVLSADHKFHNLLAEATGNPLITLLVQSLGRLVRSQQGFITFQIEGGPVRSLQHHQNIANAIRSRNPQAAREAMRRHLEQVSREIHSQSQPVAPARAPQA
jgi:DNA-binding FadR family transcriptional regulator